MASEAVEHDADRMEMDAFERLGPPEVMQSGLGLCGAHCATLEPGVDWRLTTMLTRRFSASAAGELLGTTGWYCP